MTFESKGFYEFLKSDSSSVEFYIYHSKLTETIEYFQVIMLFWADELKI